jgi:hypothetical protein
MKHVVPAAMLLTALMIGAPAARAAATPVAVYPSRGDRYEQPDTQITFRGIPASAIGTVTVVGSETGAHPGRIEPDPDGDGGSFLPDTPFKPGERVTVTTGLEVIGATDGSFSFMIEHPAPNLVPEVLPHATAPNSIQHFHSEPSLLPAAVDVTTDTAPPSGGDIFVASQYGPAENGPMILDPHGNLVWFDPTPIGDQTIVTDFRAQQLDNQPVLTWFQGTTSSGTGNGQAVILNDLYQQIATVHAGNGLHMDLHEFLVTNQGDAYILAVAPVELPGAHRGVLNTVVQEIDIRTGLVLFQWDALDHLSVYDSYTYGPKESGRVLDPFHANSISLDATGNLVVSMRNTDAVYDVDRDTGRVLWELGGKHPSFKMGPGTTTAFQHDAVVQPNGDLTVFDDGAGPPKVHPNSRAIEIALDAQTRTATLVRQVGHNPALSANFEGSVQTLPGGALFLGWGQQPYFSEVNANGQQDFDAHFVSPTASYRAYRFPWSAQPPAAPSLAVGTSADGDATLWESWNGATDVAAWRVLAGSAPSSLVAIGRYAKYRFESTLTPGTGDSYVAVQALGFAGQVLATSATQAVPAHVQIFGASAFVSSANGLAGLPVGCYSTRPCRLSATVTEGRSVLAHTGRQYFAAETGGVLYFRLSPATRTLLAHARSHRLAAEVSVQDSSGARSATGPLDLTPFSTRGAGPHRSYDQTSQLRFVSGTDFVSSTGVGALLVECQSISPCHVQTTVSAQGSTIATTGDEYIGANQLAGVYFSLSARGRALLARASGNQLPVRVTMTGTGLAASAQLALVGLS